MVMSVVAALLGSKSRADAAPADVMGRRCRGGSGKVPPPALGQRFVEMLWLGWPQRAVANRPAVVFGRRRSSCVEKGESEPARLGGRSAGAPAPPAARPRELPGSSPPGVKSLSSSPNCGRQTGSWSLNMRQTWRCGAPPPPRAGSRPPPRDPGRLGPPGRRLACGELGGRFREDWGATGPLTVGP